MMRKIFACTAMLLAGCFTNTMSAKSDNEPIWGLKVSVDAELPGKWHGDHVSWKMYRPGCGFTAGGVCNIYLPRNFYFEPGLALSYSQYRYKDLVILDHNGWEGERDPKLYKWGIQVPLIFGYAFDFSGRGGMNIFTGPQLRYAFDGKIAVSDEGLLDAMEAYTDTWNLNGQRRLDCSWKIGVGFPVDNLNISLEADLGISDLLKGEMRFRESRIGLGITYYFGH